MVDMEYGRTDRGGWIEVVCGCMFSGKTEELIKLLKRAQIAKKKIQVFKPHIDNRYQLDFIVSHNSTKLPCEVVEDSRDIEALIKPDTQVVAIDEVQFFDQNVVELAQKLASKGMQVICAGLDTDWQGRPFHPVPLLLAVAEIVRKQYAVCTECGAPATKTQRTIPSTEKVLVGTGEVYQARCRLHFSPYQYLSTDREIEV